MTLDATVLTCTHDSVTSVMERLETAGLSHVARNLELALQADIAEAKPLKTMVVRADHLWYGRHCMGPIS